MPLTAAQGRAFAERWRRMAHAESIALRRSSLDGRLRRLAHLMASAGLMGDARRLAAEDRAVHRRWGRLRRALRA